MKILTLTTDEATLVDMAIVESEGFEPLLLLVGHSIVDGEDARIGMEEDDLWFMRDSVPPTLRIGKVSGLDIRRKLYALILEIHQDRLEDSVRATGVKDMPEHVALISLEAKRNDTRRSAREGTPEDGPESVA